MARTRNPEGDGEPEQALGPPIVRGESTRQAGGVPVSELPVQHHIIHPAQVVGASFDDPKPGDPVAKRYVVTKEQAIAADGFRTLLREGSIVTDSAYDIAALRRQGVKLREATAEE